MTVNSRLLESPPEGHASQECGGLLHNRELGEILTSKTIVDSLAKRFLADQANPTP